MKLGRSFGKKRITKRFHFKSCFLDFRATYAEDWKLETLEKREQAINQEFSAIIIFFFKTWVVGTMEKGSETYSTVWWKRINIGLFEQWERKTVIKSQNKTLNVFFQLKFWLFASCPWVRLENQLSDKSMDHWYWFVVALERRSFHTI